ncbi:MAG: sigma-54 dependent transcriptional regulator [Candidatus Eisenbacteria bacterium]|uniref:Sigma-54 dependent transcriptional regulator n=1 Tax=Eiseniibacteriota bacterium TaxID=2212470 RepID=A0A948RV56_UNCEI|nr:sigma-54 dependent transcriptional regulator [Candidatus Eisenbacteria bacterium]MBU1948009.1 sigma-54 dependent transcriptional regulator [Candidatus Eisenbacteria bacterium]MBU2691440.1 sigma-54 dependent transcriptional regulator [Candidatus Eisenbacteria bacterium]
MDRPRILIADDEESMRRFLTILLEREGSEVRTVTDGDSALACLKEQAYDVLVTDVRMPGMDGMTLLDTAKVLWPGMPIVILTAFGSEASAKQAMAKGAFQFLEKKAKNEEITLVIRNALSMRRIQTQNQVLKQELKRSHKERPIIGNSEEMEKVLRMVDRVAPTDATILIYGESGTGKELIAREIHYRSQRANGPFVSINCGALPKDLLESSLFGHIKGSFTGAIKDQPGLFVAAEGGSFFLDEVGEMAPATQVKLLRALQEREIIPVGGTRSIPINARLIAATNVDLEREVLEGNFRTDLFYRLNVIPVRLPSLRQRVEDIPLLVEHFLRRFSRDNQKRRFSRGAMEVMQRYDWNGNVRELENVVERAVILSDAEVLEPEDLPESVLEGPNRKGALIINVPVMTLEELEREYILRVLQHTNWQKKKASETLGINASTLYRKLLTYNLQQPGSKPGDPNEDAPPDGLTREAA